MAANALTPTQNADLNATSRELWDKTIKDQVLLRIPLLAKLFDMRQIKFDDGTRLAWSVDTAEIDDLAQDYGTGDAMTAGRKKTLTKPWLNWKKMQVPILLDEEEMNENGGSNSIVDLSAFIVKKGQRAARIALCRRLYASASSDSGDAIQGVYQALIQATTTYAHVTRSTTVNTWFQSASVNGAWTDQATAAAMSVSLMRSMVMAMSRYGDADRRNFLFTMGENNYLTLKAQVQASVHLINPGPLVKYGFDTFMLDGNVEIVCDTYLSDTILDETTPQQWVFGFNAEDWKLWLFRKRAFNLTPFVWQGQMANQPDAWLARVLLKGNLAALKPNGSIMRTAISG